MAVLDPTKAVKELQEKSLVEIERATAITWGNRACASFQLSEAATNVTTRARFLQEAQNYKQECIEHAAMTEDWPFLQQIVSELEAAAQRKATQVAGRAAGA